MCCHSREGGNPLGRPLEMRPDGRIPAFTGMTGFQNGSDSKDHHHFTPVKLARNHNLIKPENLEKRLTDTSAEAERVQIEILRSMPSWEKMKLWNDPNMAMRQVALAGLRDRFPSATREELRRRLATLLLGPELATQVYGPEPNPPTIQIREHGEDAGATS